MRTQDILHMLNEYLPQIKFTPIQQHQGKISLTGLNELRVVIDTLGQVPFLEPITSAIKTLPAIRMSEGTIVDPPIVAELQTRLNHLLQAVSGMQALLAQNAKPQDPESISIKLPEIQSLAQLASFVRGMELVFDMPVRRLIGDGVRFSGFDTGSDWLLIGPDMQTQVADLAKHAAPFVTGAYALSRVSAFIFNFLDRFQAWRMDCLRYESLIPQVEYFRGTATFAGKIRDMQVEVANELKEVAVKKLMEAQAPNAKPEEIAEARNAASIAMSELEKWVKLGAEVHLALNAPKEIQKLLPEPVTAALPAPKALAAHPDPDVEPKDEPKG